MSQLEAQTETARWIDWTFDGLAIIFFAVVLYLVWQNVRNPKDAKARSTIVPAFLAVFCALMGNPERFQTFRFSFTGIETSARQAIQKVEITIHQLRELAASFARANFDQLAISGDIFSNLSMKRKLEVHDRIIKSLKEIGISDEEISNIQGLWIYVNLRILLDIIEETAIQLLSDPKAEDEIQALPKADKWGLPSPETMKNWISTKSLNDAKLNELLEGYQQLWTTGTMKNPDLIPANRVMKQR